jgi:hypothetical protein
MDQLNLFIQILNVRVIMSQSLDCQFISYLIRGVSYIYPGNLISSQSTFSYLAEFDMKEILVAFAIFQLIENAHLLDPNLGLIDDFHHNNGYYFSYNRNSQDFKVLGEQEVELLFEDPDGESLYNALATGEILYCRENPKDLKHVMFGQCTCLNYRKGYQCHHLYLLFFLVYRARFPNNGAMPPSFASDIDKSIEIKGIDPTKASRVYLKEKEKLNSTVEGELEDYYNATYANILAANERKYNFARVPVNDAGVPLPARTPDREDNEPCSSEYMQKVFDAGRRKRKASEPQTTKGKRQRTK